METELQGQEKTGFTIDGRGCVKAVFGKIKATALNLAKKTKEVGQDDPRRIMHSLKVGLALTLVSFFYYVRPLYNGFGSSGMWAVMTVVVVFEFTVGATLSKSMNRGFATLLAGALGIGVNHLGGLVGEKGEPIILGLFVFVLAAASTYMRFFPHVKARYDYGVLIFILTFSLVSISGYRVEQIVELAHQRLSTILLGGAICIIISIFVCPVWAGQDLHNLVATNLDLLSNFLEGFGSEYFGVSRDGNSTMGPKEVKSFINGYKSVLNAKSTEESLANFAWWEPGHGSFLFCHPWKQYLDIGGLTRQCAYHIEALSAYLNSEIQAPLEFQRKIQEPCMKMSLESGKALKELALAIKTFAQPSSVDVHIESSKRAVDELKTVLEAVSRKEDDLLKMIPSLTVSSILADIVKCVEKIDESVHELSRQAQFKNAVVGTVSPDKPQLLRRGIVKPLNDGDGDGEHVIVMVHGTSSKTNQITVV
ncbi:aluminum-activated malate transporter 8-like [Rhododendron vialii]|uniref:aluminum-activated malate transporter 8-like n=1 Tax=Rhododendron vialii TaxID=182163 RepID=UPI00265F8D7B|nr:aluminum-activated malate transporter 8-like [Rhododendron vialii]